MRHSLLLFLLLSCTGAVAQEKLDSARMTWADTSRTFTDRTLALAYFSFFDSTCTPFTAAAKASLGAAADTGSAVYQAQLGTALFGFGLRATWLDDHEAALNSLRKAQAVFAGIPDRLNMARCSAAIGGSYLMMGRLGEAITHLQAGVNVL